MTIDEQKKELRKEMLGKRKQLDAVTKSFYDNWICSELLNLINQENYQVIHSYIPMAGEINITPLLEDLLQLNITVICPKTLPKRQLENRKLISLSELETGVMKTQHPATANLYNGNYDLIIVPGLAFDDNNFRLGYGGGYYDNFIAGHKEAFKVGVFYPFQKVNAVPLESHDERLSKIIAKDF